MSIKRTKCFWSKIKSLAILKALQTLQISNLLTEHCFSCHLQLYTKIKNDFNFKFVIKVPLMLQMKSGRPQKSQNALGNSSGAPTSSFSPSKRISLGKNDIRREEKKIYAHTLIFLLKTYLNSRKKAATQKWKSFAR